MPEHHLGLLKSLALRPTRSIAVNLTPIVSALQVAGYVTLGPEGWAATAVIVIIRCAHGCATIEQSRIACTHKRAISHDFWPQQQPPTLRSIIENDKVASSLPLRPLASGSWRGSLACRITPRPSK